jgi:hypothetical protein
MAALQNILAAISSAANVVGIGPTPPSLPRKAEPPPLPPPSPIPPSTGYSGEDPRFLLRMYNAALCGIMDKLVFNSTPSGYVYVAEQVCPLAALSKLEDVCPKIIPKMDHLVCFLPGTIRLGLESNAGHESMAVEMETQIRIDAVVQAILELEESTGKLLFVNNYEEEATVHVEETDTVAEKGRGEAGEENINQTFNERQSDREEDISDSIHVHLHLPSRFKSKQGYEFVQEVFSLLDSWLLPSFVGRYEEFEGEDTTREKVSTTSGESATSVPSAVQATSISKLLKEAIDEAQKTLEDELLLTCSKDEMLFNATADDISYDDTIFQKNNKTFVFEEKEDDEYEDATFCSLINPQEAARALLFTARGLQRTCQAEYARTATGLAPEIVTFYRDKDFTPNSDARHSLLRPETLESAFVFFQLAEEEEKNDNDKEEEDESKTRSINTKNKSSMSSLSSSRRVLIEEKDLKERERIRDWAWSVYDSIEQHARYRGGGYASVSDVDYPGIGGPKKPSAGRVNMNKGKMESFALAETIKYLYLILADVSEVDRLLPRSSTVLNTEAHVLHVIQHD